MLKHRQIPKWLHVGSIEVNAATGAMSKQASNRGLVVPIGTKKGVNGGVLKIQVTPQ